MGAREDGFGEQLDNEGECVVVTADIDHCPIPATMIVKGITLLRHCVAIVFCVV
jgi:hypothetical protein